MDEVVVTALGVIATVLSGLSLLPQVIRTCRTRSAGDISGTWLAVALLSMAMWDRLWWPNRRACCSLGQPHNRLAGCHHFTGEARQLA
jgi:hypothetical protein